MWLRPVVDAIRIASGFAFEFLNVVEPVVDAISIASGCSE
jgi:hypothetical protein